MAVELVENIDNSTKPLLKNVQISGNHRNILFNALEKKLGYDSTANIFTNAINVTQYLIDPTKQGLSKVLCLGKVQSGKTSFFISAISLAFDNGYDIAYLIGGTKNALRDQNAERVTTEFNDDNGIVVVEANKIKAEEIKKKIDSGKKIVIVVLKNAAKKRNLGKIKNLISELGDIPSLIIDDEGDEVSPGAPKLRMKNNHGGRAHDAISGVLDAAKCCTYLSVTATPQANILLPTIDELSPDYISLVEPGKGYTGGNAFHDVIDNPHVIRIDDTDDFEESIPETFTNCLHFFIFACCLKNDNKVYSMLVHPSALTKIHNSIAKRITDYIEKISGILQDKKHVAYDDSIDLIRNAYNEYNNMYPGNNVDFSEIEKRIPEVLNQLGVYVYNATDFGRSSMKDEKEKNKLYKIYVGGSILERGLTIDHLIVTYIYRDSKETAIDSLYQRARWFGYKEEYFDVCRVYMTQSLKQKFIATVESENDLWDAVRSFLLTKMDFKEFPRVFSLNYEDSPDGRLILTRKTVANTVVLSIQRSNPGYVYDKSVWFENGFRTNRELYESFFDKWKDTGHPQQFGSIETQTHYVIDMTYSEFYNDFLAHYVFPRGSKFGPVFFKRLMEQVKQGSHEDSIKVLCMRYASKEFRELDPSGYAIKELPQGRSNDGVSYEGDKYLSEIVGLMYVQLHLVYNHKETPDDYVPLIAFNNPVTIKQIKYVTGDNDYGTV